MTRCDELLTLAGLIESQNEPQALAFYNRVSTSVFGHADRSELIERVYGGSRDAAQKLHDELVSGWIIRISQIRFGFWRVQLWKGDKSFGDPHDVESFAGKESLARTGAILRALASMEDGK